MAVEDGRLVEEEVQERVVPGDRVREERRPTMGAPTGDMSAIVQAAVLALSVVHAFHHCGALQRASMPAPIIMSSSSSVHSPCGGTITRSTCNPVRASNRRTRRTPVRVRPRLRPG